MPKQKKSPFAVTVQIHGIITLAELRAERERVEKLAREHALQAAMEYYFPGLCATEDNIKSLKHIVFTNWLQDHAFNEKFEGLRLLSLN